MAGLPLDAWVLLIVAVGSGLGLQLAAWWAHRGTGRGSAALRHREARSAAKGRGAGWVRDGGSGSRPGPSGRDHGGGNGSGEPGGAR